MEINLNCMRGFSVMITLMLFYTVNVNVNVNVNAYKLSTKSKGEVLQPQVPCFFIFGDSLVDNGNNNKLLSLVKANFWPYGIDFPQGATGRFNNGRTIVDLFAEHLGFSSYMPPFANASLKDFITGVNFASGAAGIRDETGNFLGINIPMNKQIGNFGKVVEQLWEYLKEDTNALQKHINKCIFYSGMGNNDYLNNYFITDVYPTSLLYDPKEFSTALIQDYLRQLKALYNLGARKIIIPGIGPMGCIPIKRKNFTMTEENPCDETENDIIQIFNSDLRGMVDNLNSDSLLPGAKFVYLNFFKAFTDVISNKEDYGLEVIDKGCCGEEHKKLKSAKFTCLPLLKPCQDRTKYLFWDGFHPTEVAHMIFAKKAYNESTLYTHPINIKQLAML